MDIAMPQPTFDAIADLAPAQLPRFAALLAEHAPSDGTFDLPARGVSAIRLSHKAGELMHAVQRPALCIVAQGAKRVFLASDVFDYDASSMLVFSVDLPVAGQVMEASVAKPYLCFRLDLDSSKIVEMLPDVFPQGVPECVDRGLFLGRAQAGIIATAVELLDLLRSPEVDELRADRLITEILGDLLRSAVGPRVAQIGMIDSKLNRIAKAIAWLQANFWHPTSVKELSDLVHMSASSFHQHFKAVTAMSPLQFQKALRLQEARRIMLSDAVDATAASLHVGYGSASQFSREFSRFFGSSPKRHVARLRALEAAPHPIAAG